MEKISQDWEGVGVRAEGMCSSAFAPARLPPLVFLCRATPFGRRLY
jgi:hypothetical protein